MRKKAFSDLKQIIIKKDKTKKPEKSHVKMLKYINTQNSEKVKSSDFPDIMLANQKGQMKKEKADDEEEPVINAFEMERNKAIDIFQS